MSAPANELIDALRVRDGELRVSLTSYRGFPYVDLRQYWWDEAGVWRPTRRGVTVRAEHLPRLRRAERRALELGALDSEAYQSIGEMPPADAA